MIIFSNYKSYFKYFKIIVAETWQCSHIVSPLEFHRIANGWDNRLFLSYTSRNTFQLTDVRTLHCSVEWFEFIFSDVVISGLFANVPKLETCLNMLNIAGQMALRPHVGFLDGRVCILLILG